MEQVKVPPAEAVARVRFETERKMLVDILRDAALQRRAGEVMKKEGIEANRRRLLASGLRITDRIIPSIVEAVRLVRRITHLEDREVETYVYADARQNAACMDFGDGRFFLMLSSSLVERMTERELLFVIGHEFGHACYGHHVLPVRGMMAGSPGLNAEQALKVLSWSRRAEISADRVGLLCCQDRRVATTALIKLSCGLTEPLIQFNADDYVSQMEDIRALSESVRDTQDWYSSHPFNPLRVVALHCFWGSKLLTDLLGLSPATWTAEEMDGKINTMLRFMEPEVAAEGKSVTLECLLWGGFWLAVSDGHIDELESASIRALTDGAAVRKAEAEIKASPDPLGFIRERFGRAARGSAALSAPERHTLVQRLIVVARADKVLREEEKVALGEICKALGVSPTFVEQILMMTG